MKHALVLGSVLGALALLPACKKANHHDNTRPPAEGSFSEKPVQNHRFDGNETNPYTDPDDKGGEAAPKHE